MPLLFAGLDILNTPFETREAAYANCKVAFFSRDAGTIMPELLEARKRYGFKIIVDVDDWMELSPTHVLYDGWNKYKIWERFKALLPLADALTVTTQRLADRMLAEKWHTNIFVIPNAMPFKECEYEQVNQFLFKDYHEGEETRFIWGGGVTHYRDIKKNLSGIFRKFPNLNFSMAGYNDSTENSKTFWDKMERLCSNNLHNPRYERICTKPVHSYATSWDYQDVAFAPLDGSDSWNWFKSSLKVYEAGVKKIACIASACPPYTDSNADGVTYCKTSADWDNAVRKHKDLAYAREQGVKLYNWVKQYRNLETINKFRLQCFDFIHRGGNALDAPTFEEFLNLKNETV
jgi:hypothetical protein